VLDETELQGREVLRDTPEGELWTSVLVDALEGLRQAVDWLNETYDERRTRMEREQEAGVLKPVRYRERLRELERDRKEREEQVASCRWFFFHRDSALEFICSVLDYPADLIRQHARRILSDIRKAPGQNGGIAETPHGNGDVRETPHQNGHHEAA
jgi:hypothetical protein